MIKWTKEEEEEEEGVWSVAGWMSVLDGSVYIKGRGGEGRRFHYLLPGMRFADRWLRMIHFLSRSS